MILQNILKGIVIFLIEWSSTILKLSLEGPMGTDKIICLENGSTQYSFSVL